ncbi:MAG: alpha/beta hydrolase [Prochloraceae cyanobacterium]|nr:alpha/beta hydrolase [Prochloraceae cyanobacterium]
MQTQSLPTQQKKSISPDVLWINTNPSFQRFDRPLIRYISKQIPIAQWEYSQTTDEPCCLDIALVLLHDYLKSCSSPVHLIGHSTGGWVGLLYARKHPERVKSLTLLGVGCYPSADWHAHYYALRQLLPACRQMVLTQMVYNLFGKQDRETTKNLVKILEKDLENSPSPHSLYERKTESPGGVSVPLMVCGSKDDIIVDPHSLQGWSEWFKEGDRLWECPQGHHFFHYFYSQEVGRQITKFWQSLDLI